MIIRTDKIAILMATYNGEKYIKEQIESILNQSLQNFVLIISDDCSTDGTRHIISEYVKSNPGLVFDLNNNTRFGNARDNFLHLLNNVEADYYMFSDQDDVWKESKVEKTYVTMRKNEEEFPQLPVVVHTDLSVVDSKMRGITSSFGKYMNLSLDESSFNSLLIQNVVTGCTMMINKKMKMLVSLSLTVNNLSRIHMHDWWVALIASALGKLVFIPESTIFYRQHENNVVGAKDVRSASYLVNRILKYDYKVQMQATMDQASLFAQVYGDLLKHELYEVCKGFGQLKTKNKVSRLNFYVRNRVFKQGLIRRTAQIIWG